MVFEPSLFKLFNVLRLLNVVKKFNRFRSEVTFKDLFHDFIGIFHTSCEHSVQQFLCFKLLILVISFFSFFHLSLFLLRQGK